MVERVRFYADLQRAFPEMSSVTSVGARDRAWCERRGDGRRGVLLQGDLGPEFLSPCVWSALYDFGKMSRPEGIAWAWDGTAIGGPLPAKAGSVPIRGLMDLSGLTIWEG